MSESEVRQYQVAIWRNSTLGAHAAVNPVWEKQLLDPMTGPEVVEWSKFNRFNFTDALIMPLEVKTPYSDPRRRMFEVHKVNNSPLSDSDLEVFRGLKYDEIDNARSVVLSMSGFHRRQI